jgi:centrosomal CEP192-like protein
MMRLRDIFVCAPLRDQLTTAKTACGRITRSICHDTRVRARGAQQGSGLRILLSDILILLSCFLALAFCGRIGGATTTAATAIISPAPGSTLTSASTTFTWSAASAGVTGYGLNVGTTPGGANLVNMYPLSGTSTTVKLPTNGATIYVRLWTVFNGATFLHNDYTYTEFTQLPSAITSPTPGSTLTSAATTFTWNAGPAGTTGYGLNVGTTLGGADLVNIGPLSGTSVTVNLPTNGTTIYVRLWTILNGTTYLSNDYTYTEFSQSASAITSPAPGSTLTSASTTFTWNAGPAGTTGYGLNVGTSPGGANLVNVYPLSGTSITVNLPTNGAAIYVRLWTVLNGATYLYNDYTYSAASSSSTLSGLSCASASMTAAGTDSCTVTLNAAAPSGGLAVSLASSNTAVVVPASVTVAAGATTAGFTATVSSVSTAQTVTLTASANSVATTFTMQLGTATPTLSTNATTIAFGTVNLNSTATQQLVLMSTGSAPVTISAATVTGSGFSISGGSFPMTLNSNQTASISVQFDPTVAGAATGQLSITSNCSMGPSMEVSLSGTGAAVPYEVNLTWDAPTSSTDPVAGYNVYRAPSGSTNYQQLNSATVTETTYVDTTVLNSETYDYIVESVDGSGVTSSPSNMAAIPVP